MTNKYRHFLESNFGRVKILPFLVYLNQNNDIKLYKDGRCYNGITKS